MTTDGGDAEARGAAAARASAFGRAAESGLSGASLLAAMGGVRGLVEALLPGIAFLVIFTITGDLWWSVGVPAALGVVFVVARLVTRQSAMPAIAGLVGAIISGVLALRTGEGADYFVLGFYTNGAYAVAFLISLLIGWPIIGVVAGLLYNTHGAWRRDARVKRWMNVATIVWICFFLVRLAVQIPLWVVGATQALGITRLVMGTPMYAILIVVTALFARSVFTAAGFGRGAEEAERRDGMDARPPHHVS